jgi:thioredoxin reductase
MYAFMLGQFKSPFLTHSLDLTKYGSKIIVLVRRDELRASKIMAKRLLSHPKVVCV